MDNPHTPLGSVLAFTAFAAFWCFVCVVLAFVGRWRELAREYPRSDDELNVVWKHFCSADFGLVHYGGTLSIGVDAKGLYLSVMLPLRAGHPPIFIPWKDIKAREATYLWIFPVTYLSFSRVPSLEAGISRRLARTLADSAGPHWPAAAH